MASIRRGLRADTFHGELFLACVFPSYSGFPSWHRKIVSTIHQSSPLLNLLRFISGRSTQLQKAQTCAAGVHALQASPIKSSENPELASVWSGWRDHSGWFEELASWLSKAPSVRITKDWIDHHYKEAKVAFKKSAGAANLPRTIKFKAGPKYFNLVKKRRSGQATFKTIEANIRSHVRRCARGELSNSDFWTWFWQLWGPKSEKKWKFQGKGAEISRKRADWREACNSLSTILSAARSSRIDELDDVVVEQLDVLSKSHNPVRKAWFSEMLCHFFPNLYPVENGPVRRWLKKIRWQGTPGLSWGNRYVELAGQLRAVVASKPAGARNLAELDTIIWAHAPKLKRLTKKR